MRLVGEVPDQLISLIVWETCTDDLALRWADYLESKRSQTKARRNAKAELEASQNLTEIADSLDWDYYDGRFSGKYDIRWVTNQNRSRWGSITHKRETGLYDIRISHRLGYMPWWVRDKVICHELSHMAEWPHNATFREWEGRYPHRDAAQDVLRGRAEPTPNPPSWEWREAACSA
tara:strand:- start:340 stop:867 length:528 start_codon:yes stop_codon:yes gene_type:complete